MRKILVVIASSGLLALLAGCEPASNSSTGGQTSGGSIAPPPPASGLGPPPPIVASRVPPNVPSHHPLDEPAGVANDPVQRSADNLKVIAQGMLAHLQKTGRLPARATSDRNDSELLSWRVHLLPYLGLNGLYSKFQLKEAWDSPHNQALLAEIPDEYRSPERGDEKTNYVVLVGSGTAFSVAEGMLATNATDGIENTILVVEADDEAAVPWTSPEDLRYVPSAPTMSLGKLRKGMFLAVAGDGVVRKIDSSTTPRTIRAYITATGGEPLDTSQFVTADGRRISGSQAMRPNPGAPHGRPVRNAGPIPGRHQPPGFARPGQPGEEIEEEAEDLDKAREALQSGKERVAFQYLYSHVLTSENDTILRDMMRWHKGISRPAIALRWGIGVNTTVRAGSGVGQLFTMLDTGIGGRRFGGGGGFRGGGSDASASAQLQDFTGNISELLVEEISLRVSEGAFGEGFFALGIDPEGETFDHGRPPQRFNARNERARIGGRRRVMPLAPGVVYLGQEDNSTLLENARKEGIDVLLVFNITAKRTRMGIPTAMMNLRLTDVREGKESWHSKALNSTQILKAQQNAISEDPIESVLEGFVTHMDEQLQAIDIPEALKPEHVERRVESLASGEYSNPLPVLTEIRLWNAMNLLPDEQLVSAYQQLIGESEGKQLAEGSPDEREAAISKWTSPEKRRIRRGLP